MIHILGAGSIGSLFGVLLASNYPVELLLRSSSFAKYPGFVELSVPSDDDRDVVKCAIPAREISPHSGDWKIEKLFVAVKSYQVVSALQSIRHHITVDTEILTIHNGMGVLDEIKESWDGPLPKIAFGVTDAAVRPTGPHWKFNYTGRGFAYASQPENRYMALIDEIISINGLVNVEKVSWGDFLRRQKHKLVVNATVNPLTAILGCQNYLLYQLDPNRNLIKSLVEEICGIMHLDAGNMLNVVSDVLERTALNATSMLCDVSNGRDTEISYINGFIVAEAQRQGKTAPINKTLCDLVKMRSLKERILSACK